MSYCYSLCLFHIIIIWQTHMGLVELVSFAAAWRPCHVLSYNSRIQCPVMGQLHRATVKNFYSSYFNHSLSDIQYLFSSSRWAMQKFWAAPLGLYFWWILVFRIFIYIWYMIMFTYTHSHTNHTHTHAHSNTYKVLLVISILSFKKNLVDIVSASMC